MSIRRWTVVCVNKRRDTSISIAAPIISRIERVRVQIASEAARVGIKHPGSCDAAVLGHAVVLACSHGLGATRDVLGIVERVVGRCVGAAVEEGVCSEAMALRVARGGWRGGAC